MNSENVKCLFCSSDDVKFLGQEEINEKVDITNNKTVYVGGKNIEVESLNSAQFKISGFEEEYPLKKYLCRNCGAVFQLMTNEVLKNYNNQRKNFENKDHD